MGTLVKDAQTAAEWMATALTQSGYKADFSLESLKEIDRFFDEHGRNGQAVPGGLLSQQLGQRIFALGGYVGEVIRRAYGGEWQADDKDPQGEINISLALPTGSVIWPVQRVMKRFQSGSEDGIYIYGVLVQGGNAPPKQSLHSKP